MVAGNDAHQNVDFLGVKLDPYERSLGFVTTHILATELTEAAILEALREGRTYVQFEILGDEPWQLVASRTEPHEQFTAQYRGDQPWVYRPR